MSGLPSLLCHVHKGVEIKCIKLWIIETREEQGVGQEENVSLDQTNRELIMEVRTSCFNDEQMHKL